jgi:putative transposase
VEKQLSKRGLARSLGVSRSSLYYVSKQEPKDRALRDRIVDLMAEHPAYGYRRVALALAIGKNRAQRVMQKFGIQPKIKHRKPKYGRGTSPSGVPNRTQGISPIAPNVIWNGDFTELQFHGRKLYLATVIDRYTREVIAWQLGLHHTAQLVIDVLEEASRKRVQVPSIFHSDQGSEYTSHACIQWIIDHQMLPSHSPKAKPWKNGHQESFYDKFKLEFGKPSRHASIELLTEAIGRYIHYYNTKRIHSALRMPPRSYFETETERFSLQEPALKVV